MRLLLRADREQLAKLSALASGHVLRLAWSPVPVGLRGKQAHIAESAVREPQVQARSVQLDDGQAVRKDGQAGRSQAVGGEAGLTLGECTQ